MWINNIFSLGPFLNFKVGYRDLYEETSEKLNNIIKRQHLNPSAEIFRKLEIA